MADISIVQSLLLGLVEGLTEFLPVSSTGHLTLVEKLLHLPIDDKGVTAYTAIIQMGAIAAVVVYFRHDIWRLARAWVSGLRHPQERGSFDFRFAWFVIWGTIPIGIVGFLGKDVVSGPLRSLWFVAAGLIVWSPVMVLAERRGAHDRAERQVTIVDALVVGLVQCLALIPGVSRSGATISAGLLRGLDRVAATRLSFFLSIPALVAAGLYELKDAFAAHVPIASLLVGTAVSFVVAYATVAWLLRFVSHHSISAFVPYRVLLGLVIVVVLATGAVTAT